MTNFGILYCWWLRKKIVLLVFVINMVISALKWLKNMGGSSGSDAKVMNFYFHNMLILFWSLITNSLRIIFSKYCASRFLSNCLHTCCSRGSCQWWGTPTVRLDWPTSSSTSTSPATTCAKAKSCETLWVIKFVILYFAYDNQKMFFIWKVRIKDIVSFQYYRLNSKSQTSLATWLFN